MMSKYLEGKARDRKFPPFGPLWGKYLGPDVPKHVGPDKPCRQEPLYLDTKPLPVEAKSNLSQPRSEKITSVSVEDGAFGNTKIGARVTLKEGSEMTANAYPRSSLKHARDAVILGGEHEGLEDVDDRHESAHQQTKMLRASVSSSTLAATSTGKLHKTESPPEFFKVHITGHYPLGHESICWETVSIKYQVQFTVGRGASSLEDKWKEMVKRGVSIDYYELKEIMRLSRAPAPGPPTTSHDIQATVPDPPADTGNQSTGNNIKPSENIRRRLYTREEIKWLLDWIRLNTSPGKKRSWLDCDQAFEKEFKYSRGSVALMLKCEKLEKSDTISFIPARKMRMSADPSSLSTPVKKATRVVVNWSREEEDWLFSYCRDNFVRERVTIDWDKVTKDFNNRWDNKRTYNALLCKWQKMKRDFDSTGMSWDNDEDEELDGDQDE
ncbi:hypothetical protein RUND412_003167 [Rhizina undulata]